MTLSSSGMIGSATPSGPLSPFTCLVVYVSKKVQGITQAATAAAAALYVTDRAAAQPRLYDRFAGDVSSVAGGIVGCGDNCIVQNALALQEIGKRND